VAGVDAGYAEIIGGGGNTSTSDRPETGPDTAADSTAAGRPSPKPKPTTGKRGKDTPPRPRPGSSRKTAPPHSAGYRKPKPKQKSDADKARRAVADRLRAVGLPSSAAISAAAGRFAKLRLRLPALRRGEPKVAKPSKERLPGRDPIWAYAVIVLGALLALSSVTVVGGSQVLASRYERSLEKRTLLAPEARAPERPRQSTVTGPLNYLLLGSDIRPGQENVGDQRADTMIIVHIPVTMDQAYLISVPRDLRVQIPPYEPTGFRGGREKINGAFQHGGAGDGGVALLSQTLTDLIGVRFDGAAIIDFQGFEKVVDLLGGVHMCVDARTESDHIGTDRNGNFLPPSRGGNPVVYEIGCYDFRPWQALDYVRQRKSLTDGDFGRARHQQQLLRAIFQKAQAVGIDKNPLLLDRFIRAVGNSLTVDIGGVSLDELMFALRDIRPDRLSGITVPAVPDDIGGISYVVGLPESDTLYQAIREDRIGEWAYQNPKWVNQI
jgi:LCP family protein required for cell wall assembly